MTIAMRYVKIICVLLCAAVAAPAQSETLSCIFGRT